MPSFSDHLIHRKTLGPSLFLQTKCQGHAGLLRNKRPDCFHSLGHFKKVSAVSLSQAAAACSSAPLNPASTIADSSHEPSTRLGPFNRHSNVSRLTLASHLTALMGCLELNPAAHVSKNRISLASKTKRWVPYCGGLEDREFGYYGKY